ncbi:uncharacterized protein LOC127092404 isoform X2 [Lathyrus oleraceus]|uniref:uncharacterized protein LOC127092404 isoform X2 n=1 Tax=Pisum sativum TaxID=3888 RepID=UPI0021CF5268|nr:uncharacterized protein LOC127092404 isoform X2 [Pisum sativum]
MNKRPRDTTVYKPLRDLSSRELGELPARIFPNRLAASEDLVLRLDVFRKLDKHRGCVNTVCFNADGDVLVSGSDDRRIILWDWETGRTKLSFHSGHSNNVFQAKFMPHSDDRTIVTCAADGQVRQAQILEQGHVETKLLAKHQGRAHKLAIEPGSPHIFYTCGEDGLVQHFDLRTRIATELFTCKPLKDRWSYVPVILLNTIAIDPRNPNLFAVAGSDAYTRLFDIRKYKWDASTDFGQPIDYFCPPHLIGDERVGITGLAFSEQRELLVSYNDEFIYLFTQDMGLGLDPIPGSPISVNSDTSDMGDSSVHSPPNMDADDKVTPQVFKGHRNCETVKGVSFFGPNCEYVVSGSDCGRIFTWKKKGGQLIRVMEADKHVVNCIESHPHTTVLASSGIEHDIKIWTPKALEKATLPKSIEQVIFDGIRWFESDDDDDSDDGNEDDDMFDDNDDMFDDDDDMFDDDDDDDDVEGCDDDDKIDEDNDDEGCDDDDNIDEYDEGGYVNDCNDDENNGVSDDNNDDENNGVSDDNNDDNGNNGNFSGGL